MFEARGSAAPEVFDDNSIQDSVSCVCRDDQIADTRTNQSLDVALQLNHPAARLIWPAGKFQLHFTSLFWQATFQPAIIYATDDDLERHTSNSRLKKQVNFRLGELLELEY